MGVEPGYGETPLDPEEADALTPQAREIFGDVPKKIELYEAEQAISDEVSIALLDDIADGRLLLTDILTDGFLRDLHQKLYGDLWTWAGRYRTRDLNIGVDPEHIAVDLRGSLDNIRYRWEHSDDWTTRELGVAVHAETVRIHGFVDGNGRTTRLLADLVLLAAWHRFPSGLFRASACSVGSGTRLSSTMNGHRGMTGGFRQEAKNRS